MTLLLRAPQETDAEGYDALFASPQVGATLWPAPLPPIRGRTLLQHDLDHWARHGFGPWAVLEGDALVARGGLETCELGVEVLYAVAPEAQGRGVAVEVARRAVEFARELGLAEVVGYAWTENPASIRVLQRAGLVFEREFEHAGLPHWLGRLAL